MIEARVNLATVDAGFAGLNAQARDWRNAWKEGLKPLRADVRDHAKLRQGSDGAWPSLAATTRDARRRKRRRSRRLLGRLPTAIQSFATPRSMGFRSRAAWSAAHQDGAIVGQGAKLRAREFLWVSQEALEAIAMVLARRLESRWLRGS